MERYNSLRAWRSIRARQRGVEPDVISTNDQLMAIARQAPETVDVSMRSASWSVEAGRVWRSHHRGVGLGMPHGKTSKFIPASPLHHEEQPPCN